MNITNFTSPLCFQVCDNWKGPGDLASVSSQPHGGPPRGRLQSAQRCPTCQVVVQHSLGPLKKNKSRSRLHNNIHSFVTMISRRTPRVASLILKSNGPICHHGTISSKGEEAKFKKLRIEQLQQDKFNYPHKFDYSHTLKQFRKTFDDLATGQAAGV